MDFLLFLEQNGVTRVHNVLVLLFSFVSRYIMTPLELVFFASSNVLFFWCLGSLRLYLYRRHVTYVHSMLVLTP